jgi:hypothetical protein
LGKSCASSSAYYLNRFENAEVSIIIKHDCIYSQCERNNKLKMNILGVGLADTLDRYVYMGWVLKKFKSYSSGKN